MKILAFIDFPNFHSVFLTISSENNTCSQGGRKESIIHIIRGKIYHSNTVKPKIEAIFNANRGLARALRICWKISTE
jgi:hypothetical protein